MWWVMWAELTHSPVHTHRTVLVISTSLGNFQKKKLWEGNPQISVDKRQQQRCVCEGALSIAYYLLLVFRTLHPLFHRHHGGVHSVLLHPDTHCRAGWKQYATSHQHWNRQPGTEAWGEPPGGPLCSLVAGEEGTHVHLGFPGKLEAVTWIKQSLLPWDTWKIIRLRVNTQ